MAQDAIQKAITALEFYADKENYEDANVLALPVGSLIASKERKPIIYDGGKKAIKALQSLREHQSKQPYWTICTVCGVQFHGNHTCKQPERVLGQVDALVGKVASEGVAALDELVGRLKYSLDDRDIVLIKTIRQALDHTTLIAKLRGMEYSKSSEQNGFFCTGYNTAIDDIIKMLEE